MSSPEERSYIRDVLLPEILEDFEGWSKEYQQPRDLGARGEFASLYRKVRKLKTILWDGADPTLWREGLRTIVKEVVSHGLLLLVDLDDPKAALPKPLSLETPTTTTCGPSCTPRRQTWRHTFAGGCRYRLVGDWLGPAEGNDA